MTSYSAFRLFLRLESPARLPLIGTVGTLRATPLLTQLQDHVRSTELNKQNCTINAKKPLTHFCLTPWRRYFSTAVSTKDVVESDASRLIAKKKAKTIPESPKVMLISEFNSISVMTLEEAKKVAVRKGLHMIPDDSAKHKTEKEVYRLVTNAEFVKLEGGIALDTEREDKKKEKEIKTSILKNNTGRNDVMSKVRQMTKWIEKGHIVRVMIGQPGDRGDPEHVFKMIEENIKDSGARILQKIAKSGQIRFQLNPPKIPKKVCLIVEPPE